MMKKTVYFTVSPLLTETNEFSTTRKLVSMLDEHFNLFVLPINGYDFKRGRVRAYKRRARGALEDVGLIEPAGDLWIVYSDGYYLDPSRLGFRRRRDYFEAQLEFHQTHLDAGRVRYVVNPPEAERRTLKSWLATLNFQETRVIPTYVCTRPDEVYELQKKEPRLVVKPIWGGASQGVRLLTDEAAVTQFLRELQGGTEDDLNDYNFQAYREGDEKRLWFVGGEFIGARRFHGRETPWSGWTHDYEIEVYDQGDGDAFTRDLDAAQRLCALSGIVFGGVDFIGDEINEINASGTVLITYHHRKMFIDHRPAFVNYFRRLLDSP